MKEQIELPCEHGTIIAKIEKDKITGNDGIKMFLVSPTGKTKIIGKVECDTAKGVGLNLSDCNIDITLPRTKMRRTPKKQRIPVSLENGYITKEQKIESNILTKTDVYNGAEFAILFNETSQNENKTQKVCPLIEKIDEILNATNELQYIDKAIHNNFNEENITYIKNKLQQENQKEENNYQPKVVITEENRAACAAIIFHDNPTSKENIKDETDNEEKETINDIVIPMRHTPRVTKSDDVFDNISTEITNDKNNDNNLDDTFKDIVEIVEENKELTDAVETEEITPIITLDENNDDITEDDNEFDDALAEFYNVEISTSNEEEYTEETMLEDKIQTLPTVSESYNQENKTSSPTIDNPLYNALSTLSQINTPSTSDNKTKEETKPEYVSFEEAIAAQKSQQEMNLKNFTEYEAEFGTNIADNADDFDFEDDDLSFDTGGFTAVKTPIVDDDEEEDNDEDK